MAKYSPKELKKDIEELKILLQQARRQKVKDLLSVEIRKWETEIIQLEPAKTSEESSPKPVNTQPTVLTERIKNYAFDESDKFVKLYITLKDLQSLPKENITTKFNKDSFELTIMNLLEKNHSLKMTNLFGDIVPADSHHKVKSCGTLLIMMKKADIGQTWGGSMTKTEKRLKDAKDKADKPPPGKEEDPQAGLMNMMQKMYNEGDSETKRMINKAWSESSEKRMQAGGDPEQGGMGGGGMPGMGGGGMPDMASMMGGMGGGGRGGGGGGMPDMASMMGGMGGGGRGRGGMPDMASMMNAMGGGGRGGAGRGGAGRGEGGMPDIASMMTAMGGGGMPDMASMMSGMTGKGGEGIGGDLEL